MAKLRCEHKEAKNFLERANYDRERICCVGALNEKMLLCDKTVYIDVVVVVVLIVVWNITSSLGSKKNNKKKFI